MEQDMTETGYNFCDNAPENFSFCFNKECTTADKCLRALAARDLTPKRRNISIINPEFSECAENKDNMPDFVFMQDETLQRPTFQSYKITKLVPRADGAVEVYTQSSCNGNWFGLCNGNIIYVMKNIDSRWRIIDMYALEF